MALLTINAAISGVAAVGAKAVRITQSGASVSVSAAVTSVVVRMVAARSTVTTAAATTSKPTRMRLAAATAHSSARLTVANVKQYKTIGAAISVKTTVEAYRTDRDISVEIRGYLPTYYSDFNVVDEMVRTDANEATRMQAQVQTLLNEFYIETATDAGVTRWERICGIATDRTKPLEVRKAAVRPRLHGYGVTTKASFRAVVNAFYACLLTETPRDFTVVSTILSKRGVPENIAEMEQAVTAVRPAHLVHELKYTWLPWDEVEEVKLTWSQAEQFHSWDQLETTFLIPIEEVLRRNGYE